MSATQLDSGSIWARVVVGTSLLAVILGAGHLGAPESWVATGAAAAMLLLPWILLPRDPGPLIAGSWARDSRAIILWSLGIFIPFALGFHLWFTVALGFDLKPELSLDRISRFESELRSTPQEVLRYPAGQRPELRVWVRDRQVYMLVPPDSLAVELQIERKGTTNNEQMSRLRFINRKLHKLPNTAHQDYEQGSKLLPGQGFSFSVKNLQSMEFNNTGAQTWILKTPVHEFQIEAGEQEIIPRNLWWLPIMLVMHILTVALPEEYFFRGFVQRVLKDKLPSIKVPLLPGKFPIAIVVASLLFALCHLASVPAPTRLAVFFPSLIFGWMYERSGSLTQPIIYHALSNVVLTTYEMIWIG